MSCQGIFQKTGSLAQPLCKLIQAGSLLFQRGLHPMLFLYL